MFRNRDDQEYSKAQGNQTNNRLHTAILERNTQDALQLIPNLTKEELNEKSHGNTPLMLALKTANFEVAREILKRRDAEVLPLLSMGQDSGSDARGITPLHLACAWRENDIILTILERYRSYVADLDYPEFDIKNLFASDGELAKVLSIQLALQERKFPGLENIHKKTFATRSLEKIYHDDLSHQKILGLATPREYDTKIVDSCRLILIGAPELTDALLFHSKSICLNLGLLKEKDFEVEGTDATKKYPSSQRQFAHEFTTGLSAIITHRNQKPIDQSILTIFGGSKPSIESTTKNHPK